MCDVFCEPVKCITNHGTPFPGAHTGGNGEPRRGNSENSGNGGARGSNERYKGKNKKMTILDEQVLVAAEITTGHKEGVAARNANTTEGAPQAGPWGA